MQKKYSFEQIYDWLKEYKAENGNLLIPIRYIRPDGIKLGHIVNWIRSGARKLSFDEKSKLDDIGFVWHVTTRNKAILDEVIIEEFKIFKEEHEGNCIVPERYVSPSGVKLGDVFSNIRSGKRKLSAEFAKQLNDLGFVWKEREKVISMDKAIELLETYKNDFGNCNVPSRYVTSDGYKLGVLVCNIRYGHRKISDEEMEKLNQLGFDWKNKKHKKLL